MARIISVVDAYDAFTSDRQGQAALSHVQAAERLRAMAGRELDPDLVSKFLDMHNV